MEATYLATDAAIRGHLDLMVGPRERRDRTAFFVLCDDAGRPLAHVCVDDLVPDPPVEECALIVEPLATALMQEDPDGRILVALTRPESARINDVDRRWFHAAHATCRSVGVALVGVYVATTHDIVEIRPDDAT